MITGAGRLPLAGRGFLATLEALGDAVQMGAEELQALFGEGWMREAETLRTLGYIDFGTDGTYYALGIRYPDERRRRYRRRWMKEKKASKGKTKKEKKVWEDR